MKTSSLRKYSRYLCKGSYLFMISYLNLLIEYIIAVPIVDVALHSHIVMVVYALRSAGPEILL